MTLFNIKQIAVETKRQADQTKSKAAKTRERSTAKLGKARMRLEKVIGAVKMGQTIHYASVGEWSTHDLIFYLIKQTGPVNLYLSTWSVSEDAVRQLIEKIKSGDIKKIFAVFDWRVKVRRPQAFELANYNIADIRLSSCHAKVTVIENKEWSIAVVGSANYTNNPRIEAGVISCDKVAADFHKDWINGEISRCDPFDVVEKKRADKSIKTANN